jgi:hypothetical protein
MDPLITPTTAATTTAPTPVLTIDKVIDVMAGNDAISDLHVAA